jgi:dethiobiotin synthetase
MNKYFITATGTGIGKTFVTTALCSRLIADGKKVVALKPVISGYVAGDMESDSLLILQACEQEITEDNIAKISPWRFAAPLSPDMAAQKEGKNISFPELVIFCTEHEKSDADILLVEGVGGVCVPLNEKYMVLDWIEKLEGWKVILVIGSYLGSISHTLTAMHTLAARNIRLHAVIISESEDSNVPLEETIDTLKNFLDKSVIIFKIPRQQKKDFSLIKDLKRIL